MGEPKKTPSIRELGKSLKDLSEVLERLRNRRREIKSLLAKDPKDDEEEELASELGDTSRAMQTLEVERRTIVTELGATAPAD